MATTKKVLPRKIYDLSRPEMIDADMNNSNA